MLFFSTGKLFQFAYLKLAIIFKGSDNDSGEDCIVTLSELAMKKTISVIESQEQVHISLFQITRTDKHLFPNTRTDKHEAVKLENWNRNSSVPSSVRYSL